MVTTFPQTAAMGKAPGRVRRSLSVRGHLLVMVAAILLPVGAFAGILFWRYADSEIARIDQQLENDAHGLALDVDRDLQGKIVTLETLATEGAADAGDYARFYARATRLKDFADVNIALRNRDGQQLANTRVPFGTSLPRNPFPSDDRVASTKKPYVSNIVDGLVAGHPVYFISVPIIDNGAVAYFLHMSVDLAELGDLLHADIGPQQVAGILDRDNMVMTRTEGSRERVGKPASKNFVEQIKGPEGTWLGQNVQGYKIRVGYARSKLSGWLIWVGVPDADIQNSLRRTLWRLSGLGLALTVLALGLAYWLGGKLAGASRTLAAQASALGRGEAVSSANIPVRELDEVGHELVAAASHRKDLERQLVATATRESEQLFQVLVHGVTDYAIYMLDPQGNVTNWNTGAMRITGYRESEIVGRHFSVFHTPEDRADGVPARALLTAINEGRYEAEGWRVRKDGTRFWASAVIDRIEDSNGNLIGLAKITRDITERREAQQRLDNAREQLYQSQKMDAVV
jgi:PAS domain S-box-containing protein